MDLTLIAFLKSTNPTNLNFSTPASTPTIGEITIIDVEARQIQQFEYIAAPGPERRKVVNPSPMWEHLIRLPIDVPNKPLTNCNHCSHKVGVQKKD